ncbi:Large repetitive protein [Cystobacter fuscus DSM 2262]|uniref:Large repetitive protein n=1 Tax=Cystobacter fuscus (strain ATCC 25194 / DSM 2262 / NBRC 100088 / M29) TaxID=1242864 RepID=S9QTW5_CYSF2|nr:Ig-like domain-containing protein [Cystobacter fuscus]EPX60078.1 Large repetitive protein [Cystobacter fuscus DSM 2262]
MKNTLFTKWLAAALWVLALGSTAALAEPDTFYLGDGHNGPFTADPESIVNSYAQVVSPLLEGDTEIIVGNCTPAPCFSGGDLVMVFQTTGFLGTPQVEEPATSTSLNNTEVGRWELARVDSVSGTTLKLRAPLIRGYAAQVTQIIRVPEFTSVTVGPDNFILAKPWDGKVGGVVAFLATGLVRNLGTISAEGAGFRGGVFVGDPGGNGSTGCSGDAESPPKGAQKGEGIANTSYGPSHTGRGYVLNGGGGGVCFRSGGGGGANHGKGGRGGFSSSTDGSRGVGGRAGAPIEDYALLNRLIPGGGGGAGHGSATSAQRGGSGGGVVFIRANSLSGSTGSILATGSSGYYSSTDAAGGGGAGGSIHLRLATSAICGDIDASGGNGGSPNTKQVGPGGGGGGGVILLQASKRTGCVADSNSVLGGLSGSQKDSSAPGGVSYGAESGAGGRVETIDRGFAMLDVPTVSAPANGAYTDSARPNVSGTATPNTTVVIYIDGKEARRGTSDAAGGYGVVLLDALTQGAHTVQAATELDGVQSLKSTANAFTVDTLLPDAPAVTVPGEGDFVITLRPVIQGTAEAGSTVSIYLDNRSPVTVAASDTGEWTYTPDFDLAQGAHTVKATATDTAGNVSPESNVRGFNVDTLVPAAPVVSTPAQDSHSKNPRPAITGTAESGTTVTIYLDGVALGTAPVTAGSWSYALTSDLSDDTYDVKATARDAAGNVSPESTPHTFTIDTVAPAAPVVSTPTEGAYVTTPVRIAGTAEAGSTVTVLVDGVPVGVATANASGEWTYETSAVLDGPLEVKVTATDAANNTGSESNTRTFIVDATVPVAPVVSTPADGAFVNTRTPVITGTAEADTTVTVYLNGSVVGTAPVDGTGAWNFTTAELTDGATYTVKVTAKDAAGNISPESNTHTVHVDVTVPVAPVVTAPDEGTLFNTRTPVITGTAEAGTTVTVYLDGSVVDTAPVNALGNWSFTTAELSDGTYTVKVTATDAANNTSPESNTRTFRVDATAPAAPVITAPADGALINTRVNVITGTAEAGTTVTVYLNGSAVGTAPVDGAGAWSFTTAELTDGTYTVKATATDAANNTSPESSTRTFRVDATAPAAPVITAPADGALVNTRISIIMGTAELGTWVTVYLNGSSVGTAPVDSVGNWSFRTAQLADGTYAVTAHATDAGGNDSPVAPAHHFTVDASAPETFIVTHPPEFSASTDAAFTFRAEDASLPVTYVCTLNGQSIACTESLALTVIEGTHTLTVSAVDALGNRDATPASFSWTVDTVAPEAPVVVTPAEGAELESDSPVVISGTSEPGSTVTLLLDGQEFVVNANDVGEWSYTASGLASGPHQVTARARDAAGNVGPESAPRSFTVLDSSRMPDTEISSGPSGSTPERDATFTFGSQQGVSFECSLDGAEFAPCTSPVTYTDLAEGEHTFQVRARDARGIADGTPASRTWTVREADIAYLGGGLGCSASGGDSSLVLMALGSLLAMARRRRAAR